MVPILEFVAFFRAASANFSVRCALVLMFLLPFGRPALLVGLDCEPAPEFVDIGGAATVSVSPIAGSAMRTSLVTEAFRD